MSVHLTDAKKAQIEEAAKPLLALIHLGPHDRTLLSLALTLLGTHLDPTVAFVLAEIAANNPPPIPA